jgi:uroporphyrin-III C-methyltransferase/precorrin-2 dehydrogenase/sirohydrochlorin ferrochelatase
MPYIDAVKGHVWLVGAGPGAQDLLTLRAQRVMMEADVLVYDALVPQEVIDMGRRDAERIAVGKRKGCHSKSQNEINHLLVSLAKEGKRAIRWSMAAPARRWPHSGPPESPMRSFPASPRLSLRRLISNCR